MHSFVLQVTGAGNGIGRQIALNLGNLGAKIVCWDIEVEANGKLVNELSNSGTKAYGYILDLSNMGSIRETSAKVESDLIGIFNIDNEWDTFYNC